MPTYQYACTTCGHQLEAVQSFSDAPLAVCPECDGQLRKVFSSVGIVFKGSGFYRTDSRSGSNGESGSSNGTKSEASGASSTSSSGTDSSSAGSSSGASSSGGSSNGGSSNGGSPAAGSAAKGTTSGGGTKSSTATATA